MSRVSKKLRVFECSKTFQDKIGGQSSKWVLGESIWSLNHGISIAYIFESIKYFSNFIFGNFRYRSQLQLETLTNELLCFVLK